MTASRPETEGRLDDRLFVACGLAWAAGLLEVVVAIDRSPLFALPALVQVVYGIALYRAPRPPVILSGVVLAALLIGIWVAANPVGPIEYVVATDELAFGVVALWAVRPKRAGAGLGRRLLRFAGTSAAVYLILLSSMALMPGSPHSGVKGELVNVPRAGFQFLCHPG